MRKVFLAAAVVAGVASFGTAAQAQLLTSTVTGTIEFYVPPTPPAPPNWYDPANGQVPTTGYNNSSANADSPTVTINNNIEFGYVDPSNTDTADFTDNTLTVTDTVAAGETAGAWEQTFTDAQFIGASFSTVSDGLGLTTATLTGDEITLDWLGTDTPGTYAATFDIVASTPIPEPASMALLATGIAVLGTLRRRRRS